MPRKIPLLLPKVGLDSLQATFSPEYEGLCRYQKYERHELNAFMFD